ncbi:hypothetical protein SEA_JEEVES_88 [Mycobacterium phage Jeeves]|uniref:Uncharacterized protein n=1 Tax=Mycobacterium phage Jeeves TaxID=2652402 RepID=A0A5J6T327_9CAUD|nr:hypothetical protein KNU75_gp021 [Mycobacterium phage Jeeves]QFG04563.1 hypothetical protein SEA_JEEVES_88 [Mycobacterium phage Jeeves]
MTKAPSWAVTAVIAVWFFGLAMALGELYIARVHADPNLTPSQVMTVDGVDYPVCSVEDCSDQPGQIGIWIDQDTGNQWLSQGETSYRIER